jgi:hypothetical protein
MSPAALSNGRNALPTYRRRPRLRTDDGMRAMRRSIVAAAGFALLFSTIPSFAFGLTDVDQDYLDAQGVERTSLVLRGLSPREQARLHAIINDATTAADPAARERDVAKALKEFTEHQAWEQAHPGELWDVRKR